MIKFMEYILFRIFKSYRKGYDWEENRYTLRYVIRITEEQEIKFAKEREDRYQDNWRNHIISWDEPL